MSNRFTIVLLMLLVGLFIGLNLQSIIVYHFFSVSENTSCEGLDGYYSNTSFKEDISHDRFAIYYKEIDDGFKISNNPESDGFDCEDISHAIYCIAQKYNIDCQFYYEDHYNDLVEGNHLGVNCYVDNKWVRYN